VRRLALAAGLLLLAAMIVCLGAYTNVGAITMPGVLLAVLATVPLLMGVTQLIWPDEPAPDARDGLIEP